MGLQMLEEMEAWFLKTGGMANRKRGMLSTAKAKEFLNGLIGLSVKVERLQFTGSAGTEASMKQIRIPLLEQHSFSRGRPTVVISSLDLTALQVLESLGGKVQSPADLGAALDASLDATRRSLIGGRHLRRLQTAGLVRALVDPPTGYEITDAGKQATASNASLSSL